MSWFYVFLAWLGLGPKAINVRVPSDIVGLGIDYNWATADHARLCRELAEAGCTATGIEFAGWDTVSPNLYRDGAESLRKPYRSLMAEARRYNITVLVSLVNDNKGSRKYGDAGRSLDQFKDEIAKAVEIVLSEGARNVILQPVSETQTSYGSQLERDLMARFNAAGFRTCYNRGSRPTSPGLGSTFNAYHPFKTSDVATAGDIIVTDTGTIISALQDGGLYGSAFNDARVEQYAKAVKAAGGRGLLVYGFTGVKAVDSGAIKAMGRAWA